MASFEPSPAYRDAGPYKTGVLLVNSGTPDSLTAAGVRSFLRRLLRDRRTIEVSRAIWCWILYFIILPLRPARVLPKYRRVWTDKGSPLLLHSKELRDALRERLTELVAARRAGELVPRDDLPVVGGAIRHRWQRGRAFPGSERSVRGLLVAVVGYPARAVAVASRRVTRPIRVRLRPSDQRP